LRAIGGYVGLFLLLVAASFGVRAALAALGLAGLDRPLGIAGTGLIALSFLYSLRKRKILRRGRPPAYLRLHELLAWVGALLVLLHGGDRIHALLPWLAEAAMLVVVASGLTGSYVLQGARQGLAARRRELAASGLAPEEVESRVLLEAVVVGAMMRWRAVHLPLTLVFAVLAVAHIATALLFWRWW